MWNVTTSIRQSASIYCCLTLVLLLAPVFYLTFLVYGLLWHFEFRALAGLVFEVSCTEDLQKLLLDKLGAHFSYIVYNKGQQISNYLYIPKE